MVVIKECFPSQSDFIIDYLAKRRQQLEILQQRKFKISFVPRAEDNVIPGEEHLDHHQNENLSETLNGMELLTPVIIPVQEEPRYVKNFNAFIQQTHQHLNQVLSNNQRIDDVHEIVTEIQKPVQTNACVATNKDIETEELQSETVAITPNYPKLENCRVTSDLYSNRSQESHEERQKEANSERKAFFNKNNKNITKNGTKVGNKLLHTKDIGSAQHQKARTITAGVLSTRSVRLSQSDHNKLESAKASTFGTKKKIQMNSYTNRNETKRIPAAAGTSQTARTVKFSPRSTTTSDLRISASNSSRSERSNWINQKVSQVPVTVINLQL